MKRALLLLLVLGAGPSWAEEPPPEPRPDPCWKNGVPTLDDWVCALINAARVESEEKEEENNKSGQDR